MRGVAVQSINGLEFVERMRNVEAFIAFLCWLHGVRYEPPNFLVAPIIEVE